MGENCDIWPTDQAVERAAEQLVAGCAQREVGHFPVDDESREIARWMLVAANEANHGTTWNPLPYRVTEPAAPKGDAES